MRRAVPAVVQPDTVETARLGTPALRLVEAAEAQHLSVPWAPVLLSALVLCAALSAAPTLTSLTGEAAPGARLALPAWYVALAPVCDSLDMMSLFSQRQHFAFLLTCAVVYVTWRLCRRKSTRSRWPVAWKESTLALGAFLGIVALYAAGILLPRPIAALKMASPDAVVVDFHSHTNFSWDGGSGFSPEENRRWHHASGFDVAYVTDHGTFAGAEQAAARNPARAGEGTVILSGIEVRSMGRHLNILGTSASDSPAYVAGDLQEGAFSRTVLARKTVRPVVLLTLPGSVKPVRSGIRIDALELSDAAPRALAQIDLQRGALLDLAERDHMAMVAGSNNHGWASASPAWSVMQIPGWRSMTPAELDVALRQSIIHGGSSAVSIVERRKAASTSTYALVWTVPLAVWQMFTAASWRESLSWLLWIWAGYFAGCWVRTLTLRRRFASAGAPTRMIRLNNPDRRTPSPFGCPPLV